MNRHASGSARLRLVAILAASLAAAVGLWLGARWSSDGAASHPQVLQNALLFPAPRDVPAFSLDGGDGQPLTSESLRGRWSLVFVGFTHCPDICPTTLSLLAEVEKKAAGLAPGPRIVFVSVDPERDSAARAAEYAHYFSPGALAATADHARLQPFARSLGMVYMQTPLESGGYTVDHSAGIAILDPEARWVGVFRPPLDAAKMAADLATLAERHR